MPANSVAAIAKIACAGLYLAINNHLTECHYKTRALGAGFLLDSSLIPGQKQELNYVRPSHNL